MSRPAGITMVICLFGGLYCAIYWDRARQCYDWDLPIIRCEPAALASVGMELTATNALDATDKIFEVRNMNEEAAYLTRDEDGGHRFKVNDLSRVTVELPDGGLCR